MSYKETTIDHVLGRVLILGAQAWRVLEVDPDRDTLRALLLADDTVRGVWSWREIRRMILDGTLIVD